ncbi:MAG: hypothetical protein WHV44_13780 [Anaerolineales bacterium]
MNHQPTRSEYLPLAVLILLNLLIGAFTLTHYGETWDEQNYFYYASQSLAAYTGLFQPGFIPAFDPTIRYYGPVFTMPAVLLWRAVPSVPISDFQHALNWLTFQAGLVIFYLLARRWLDAWPAFGATLLLATQPLLWGHAFINPKDTPYMVGFMASIYFGLKMLDAVEKMDAPSAPAARLTPDVVRADLAALPAAARRMIPVLAAGGILAGAALAVLVHALWPPLPSAYLDDGSAAELAAYLRGITAQAGLVTLIILFALAALRLLVLPRLPHTRAAIAAEFAPFTRQLVRFLRHPAVFTAALVLGLTLSIRLLAFAAAAFIGVLLLLRRRADSAALMLAYGLVALAVMFITWPYLWWEPAVRFLVTLRVMLNFPWPGQTLFDGRYYDPASLPNHYLPTLWGIQLTEPLLALALLGLGVYAAWGVRRRLARDLGVLIGLWVLLPLAAAVAASPSLYDNARQLFFILPPVFLLGGLGLQVIFKKITRAWARALVLALAILPGVMGIIQLHPYEYIYYNSLVGGVQGAEGRFELDYWGASFRAAANYLNETAPPDALVTSIGPEPSLWRYLRPDLRFIPVTDLPGTPAPFFVVLPTRDLAHQKYFISARVIFEVRKAGVLLAVVKEVR